MAVNEGAQRGRSEEQPNLPDWLQDVDIEVEADEDDISWASDIDFSNLPGWLAPDAPDDADELGMSDWDSPAGPVDEERAPKGTGLLAGVRGPIPIEPIITIAHKAPPFPGSRPASVQQNVQQRTTPLPAQTQIQPAEPQQGSSRLLRLLLVALILIALVVVVVVAAGSMDILQMIPLIGLQLYV